VKGYFQRVAAGTPTHFWINNPTRKHADWAIQAGADGCTCNPAYSQKMIDHPDEGGYASALLDEAIRESRDEWDAAERLQRKLVGPVAQKFLPLYFTDRRLKGFVSIQADPIHDEDPASMLRQALDNRSVGENICCKIPVTEAGLQVIDELVARNIPVNATEIFGVSQMIELCERYEKAAHRSGHRPPLFMSHIAGIYDDYLQAWVEREKIDISPDVLWQAGLAVARKVYRVMIERGYTAIFVAGGARGLHHFTEMVGGKLCITINWEGTADKLLETNPPVVYRLFNPVPQKVIDELEEKIPDFERGYCEDGLSVEEFEGFGPVQLFKSSFVKSWQRVLNLIKARRNA
jgi:transaldolase